MATGPKADQFKVSVEPLLPDLMWTITCIWCKSEECYRTLLYTHKSIYEIRTFTALLFDGFMRTAFSRNPIVKGTVVQKHLDSSLIAKQLSKYIAKNSPVGNTLMECWPNICSDGGLAKQYNTTFPFPSLHNLPQHDYGNLPDTHYRNRH